MMYKSKPSKLRRFGALLLIPAMGIGCAVIEIPAVASVLDKTAEVSFISADNGKVSDFSANLVTEAEEKVNFNAQETFAEPLTTNFQEAQTEPAEEVPSEPSEPDVRKEAPETTSVANNSSESQTSDQSNSISDKEEKEVYVAVEKQAEFPGGIAALMNWLSMNIRYPEKAYKENIQGRVIVKFIIEKDGKVSNPTIVRGIDPELDKESIRVVKEMPAWQPAENNGKAVASYFNLPISFKLTDDSAKKEDTTTPPTK